MSSSSPIRLARSLAESPAYDPAWRSLQVEEYLRCQRHLGNEEGKFVLPSSERDSLVRAYYKFRCGVIGPKHAPLRYAQECEDTNDRTSMASRIKAMTVAGLGALEIGQRFHTSAANIETFLKLFFEVSEALSDREVLAMVIAPMLDPKSSADPRERLWLCAALKLGLNGLKFIVEERLNLSAEEQRQISESLHTLLAEQSLRYALSLHGRAEVGSEALEAYQKNQEMRLRNPPPDNSKSIAFREGILKAAGEKWGIPAPPPPTVTTY